MDEGLSQGRGQTSPFVARRRCVSAQDMQTVPVDTVIAQAHLSHENSYCCLDVVALGINVSRQEAYDTAEQKMACP